MPSERLNEYLQAVEDGLIPSAAPQGATGGHVQSAPAAPAAVYHPNAPSTGAVTNNYARTEGQARVTTVARGWLCG